MGKRSNFPRRPQDKYDTPSKGGVALWPFLPKKRFTYGELCAGRGDLIKAMPDRASCALAVDIKPRAKGIRRMNALNIRERHLDGVDLLITNPPWTRQLLHLMIEHFAQLRPTWLLFDSDWAYTLQARDLLKCCRKIVAVGRLRWIPDTPYDGKDNTSWYLFDRTGTYKGATRFYGRAS